ncbi:reverse transcriptase domain-containing protein, partial [Tanacetum coccineum]
MEEDYEPSVQSQRRVNPKIHDVIKKEVEKLLDAGLIYPISDSPWVSPVHCVPKKGGMTVITNDENELIPTRLVTGWRVCIDYRKLNEATRKDHFPLPFMDQMLERLAGNEYYCFLDGFSGYFQIPIDPKDQEKTTFTCPYGTFAYRRMPFGLCNAPGTFQRCMMAIFHDMIEKTMEVFMDDFSVFGDSFSTCLSHLEKMLKRCEDTNLSLNWEKSHFMVKEGIVLGHKISKSGLITLTNISFGRPKVNTVSPKVNTVRPRQPAPHTTSNSMSPKRPQMDQINKRRDFSTSYSSVRRPFAKSTAQMAHTNAVMGSWGSAVKTSASYNWRNSRPNFNYNSGPIFIRTEHPLKNMVDRGIFDSGCSGHMTGNKDQLEDFEEFNGGSVTFGGSKGYISGKGRIRHKVLCDKQHQILLKVPRHHNMYSFDMKTPSPAKCFACLIAKATS